MPNPRETALRNDFFGLNFINDFRWLRPTELAKLLWGNSPSAKKNMSKLLSKWRKKQYVIERKLPDGLGIALLLSQAGTDLLRRNKVQHARSGKNWGTLEAGQFRPPQTFRHDLLVAGLLSHLQATEDRRFITPLNFPKFESDKLPDALLGYEWSLNSKQETLDVCWVEVENARKAGIRHTRNGYQPQEGHLMKVLLALAKASRNEISNSSAELNIFGAIFAFDKNARDERGYRIDHRKRLESLIEKMRLTKAINVIFAAMTVVGGTVTAVEQEQKFFDPR